MIEIVIIRKLLHYTFSAMPIAPIIGQGPSWGRAPVFMTAQADRRDKIRTRRISRAPMPALPPCFGAAGSLFHLNKIRKPFQGRRETSKVREIPTIVLMPGLICDGQFWSAYTALEQLAPTRLQVRVADFSQLSSIGAMADKVVSETAGPIVAIGHSMGGRVALEVLRRAPERVVGLALLDTGIHTRAPGEEEKRAAMIRLAYEQGMAALADIWVPPMVDPARRDDAALLTPIKEMVLRATPEQHERQMRALLDRPDPRDLLPGIQCPTLVMVGRQDQWSPLSQHEEIAALIPGAKLVVIENAGHMTLMEQPAASAAALTAWLHNDVLHGPARPAAG